MDLERLALIYRYFFSCRRIIFFPKFCGFSASFAGKEPDWRKLAESYRQDQTSLYRLFSWKGSNSLINLTNLAPLNPS